MTPAPESSAAAWTSDQVQSVINGVANTNSILQVLLTLAVIGIAIFVGYALTMIISRGVGIK